MQDHFFLSGNELAGFLHRLSSSFDLFVPERRSGNLTFRPYPASADQVEVGGARTVDPVKSFFFPARELVAIGFEDLPAGNGRKPRCIVGTRSCDLRALQVLDSVFLDSGGTADPFYRSAREEILIFASDCTEALPTCFCSSFGLEPFSDGGADFNLTQLKGGILLSVISGRARELFGELAGALPAASKDHLTERDQVRAATRAALRESVDRQKIPSEADLAGAVEARYEEPVWAEEAAECVECGACNTICPTCHCFLLFDQTEDGVSSRYKTWDSCLLRDFARVAGGHNPRSQIWTRLRNRFVKKFSFFPAVSGMAACTGCGRCIEACPAQIDIRRVLRRIASNENRLESLSSH